MTNWQATGIRPADFLLPKAPYLSPAWPVVALDQYTSQPEVWQQAEAQIGEAPSTLRLVVPEAFLEEAKARGQAVFAAMADYVARDIFTTLPGSFVLVERTTQSGSRIGLMLTVDLEEYDYAQGSTSLIRATEQTVLDRIPPRLAVREQSLLEVSHTLLLIDDPKDSVLGPIYAARDSLPLVYDLNLLMEGGRVRGWQVAKGAAQDGLAQALLALKAAVPSDGLLYAVGDGNHSLAAAKAAWEKIKPGLSEQQQEVHPARFAACELVNLHDKALLFEPIHRVAFDTDRARLMGILSPLGPVQTEGSPDITLVDAQGELPLLLSRMGEGLVVDLVQQPLDEAKLSLDYVHGEEALEQVVARQGGTGILMPPFGKDQLFPTVMRSGRLPRKTFSMGEANEKRFYLEARRIQ